MYNNKLDIISKSFQIAEPRHSTQIAIFER